MSSERIDPLIHSWRGEGDEAVCERCGIDVNDHLAAVAPCRIEPLIDSADPRDVIAALLWAVDDIDNAVPLWFVDVLASAADRLESYRAE